ncbi:MAG: RlpA-like double-psi beta-barrel domain-containing protein [Gaiellaceae bacterium]
MALAGIALLAVVVALALAAFVRGSSGDEAERRSVPVPGTGWYPALAAPYRLDTASKRTACGHRATEKTLGVAHPVLPCGAKITIRYDDKAVLTQVIDRGVGVPGREFDITTALAVKLGLRGVQPIRWRFAR